jgi:hypothetical protein
LSRHALTKTIHAPDLGLNGVTLASERTSNAQDGHGYSHLTVYLNATRAAYTALICKLEVSPDGTTWGQTKSESISSGTGTLSSYSQSFTTSSSALVPFRFDICDKYWRVLISATSGGSSDTAIVTAYLST